MDTRYLCVMDQFISSISRKRKIAKRRKGKRIKLISLDRLISIKGRNLIDIQRDLKKLERKSTRRSPTSNT